MAKAQDLKPDTVLKNYWNDNEQFADLFNGAVSLHGMLNIPEEMKRLVNDYKMMLVEARQNNLTFHNMNNFSYAGIGSG